VYIYACTPPGKNPYFYSFVIDFLVSKSSNQGKVYKRKMISVSKFIKKLEKIIIEIFTLDFTPFG
jgi:hypothetical protein